MNENASPMKVLVIEDTSADFLLIERHLRKNGLRADCRQVQSYEDLEQCLETGGWDIVLSDFRVPGMDVRQAFSEIRRHHPMLPIILVSNTLLEEEAIDLLKGGIWDFVVKDRLGRLVPAIERALEDARLRREEAESQTAYYNLFQSIREAILIIGLEGDILEANHAAEHRFGTEYGRMVGTSIGDWIKAPSGSRFDLAGTLDSAGRGEANTVECLGTRADGSHFPAELRLHMGRFLGNSVLIAAASDITERKEAEEARRQESEYQARRKELLETVLDDLPQQECLERMLEQVLAAPGLKHESRACLLMESSGESPLQVVAGVGGGSFEHCASATLQRCYCGESVAAEAVWHSPGDPEDGDGEAHFCVALQGGSECIGLLLVWPARLGGDRQKLESFLMAAAHIISAFWVRQMFETALRQHRDDLEREVRRRTSELNRARLEAERMAQVKDTFLATMSHEIRTPMNALLGMLELLSMQELPEEQRHHIKVAQETGKTLKGIINDILDYSKIEAGKLSIEPGPTSVAEVVNATVSFFAGTARDKGLELVCHVDSDISDRVELDGLRLRQLLNNFISNAIKFTDRGRVTVRAELVERRDQKETLRFSVSDTGIGISPEAQKQLFQPFTQADSEISRRYGGTGLGLAICGRLVQLMGGTLELDSAPGEGTKLAVDLEVSICSEPAGEAAPEAEVSADPNRKTGEWPTGRPVLVVDDQPTNLEVLAYQLRELGLESVLEGSGSSALEAFEKGDYAMMITDCHMPGMSGYELARRVRELEGHENRSRLPILAWTADVTAMNSPDFKNADMDLLLIKPTALATLRETVDAAFRLQQGRTQRAPSSSSPSAQTPSRAVLDRDYLAKLFDGDREMERNLLAMLRQNLRELRGRLDEALAQDDAERVQQEAHAMRGACAQSGAKAAAAACEELETVARKGLDGAAQRAAYRDVRSSLDRLDDALEAELGSGTADSP